MVAEPTSKHTTLRQQIEKKTARRRAPLIAAITAAFAIVGLSTVTRAATIVVNSLADPGAPGICALRDAITAANTMTATNGCAAGTGNDAINFSVAGTITLSSTLPEVTDSLMTVNGPASPGITISGGNEVRVMQIAPKATVKLNNLTVTDGFNRLFLNGGGIQNDGALTVTNSTFSGNGNFVITSELGGALKTREC
jgi:hypothetical protein